MAKRGRPAKTEAEKKSEPVSLRLAPDLYQQLKDAADQADRTLGQEIQARLKLSFDDRQKVAEFGGLTNYWLFHEIAAGIGLIQDRTGHEWWSDRYTFDACYALLLRTWERFKPRGRSTPPKGIPDDAAALGGRVASAVLAPLELALEGQQGLGRAAQAAASAVATKIKSPSLPGLRAEVKRHLEWIDQHLRDYPEEATGEKMTLGERIKRRVARLKEEEGK